MKRAIGMSVDNAWAWQLDGGGRELKIGGEWRICEVELRGEHPK